MDVLRSPQLWAVLVAYQDGYTNDTLALTRLLRYQQAYSKQCDYSAFHSAFSAWYATRGDDGLRQLQAHYTPFLVHYALLYNCVSVLLHVASEAQLGYKHMRLALGYGHAPVVRFLLQLPSTHVPLMMAIAADHGHVSLVQLLHDTNADPSHVWRGVMKRGHAHVARYLLAQPDLAQWPRAALRSALIDGHCALVQVLYAARAFELTTDEVVCALRSGRLEMVQFAYEHRATACLGALVLLAATEETMHILEWLCSLQAPERRHIERALDESTDAAVTSYLHTVLTRLSRVDASSPDRVAGHSL